MTGKHLDQEAPTRSRPADSERKLQLAVDALCQVAAGKQRTKAWGQVTLKLFWEDGYLKLVELTDTTTIKDVPEGGLARR